jgi:hypothetical protein
MTSVKLNANDHFRFGSRTYVLLHHFKELGTVVVIDAHGARATPQIRPVSDIFDVEPIVHPEIQAPPWKRSAHEEITDRWWIRIEPIIRRGPGVYDATLRARMVADRVAELADHPDKKLRCGPRTLESHLRRYFQNGQSPAALQTRYDRCGRSPSGVTLRRGRRTKNGDKGYQITTLDEPKLRKAVEYYLKPENHATITSAHRYLGRTFYFTMGDGVKVLPRYGQYPSYRQFNRWLKNHYSIETITRCRDGDAEFNQNVRPLLGDVVSDCDGASSAYEIDASIVEVDVVIGDDIHRIVGRPTLYVVVDRKSRLIVGFYLGFEAPSWEAAVEAFISISEDKESLCRRWGVPYLPSDWPAHCRFPAEVIGDKGEMFAKASSALTREIGVTVRNAAALRPDWKAIVESRFSILWSAIASCPGYQSDTKRRKRRRNVNPKKTAALTLRELGHQILTSIIAYNRAPIIKYPRSRDEKERGILTSPIALWKDSIQRRGLAGFHVSEQRARWVLLPEDDAVITPRGVSYGGRLYGTDDPVLLRKMAETRRPHARTQSIKFRRDRRIIDEIFIPPSSRDRPPLVLSLTEAYRDYAGLSEAEFKVYSDLDPELAREARAEANAVLMQRDDALDGVNRAAQARPRKPTSVSARSRDSAELRKVARAFERKQSRDRRAAAIAGWDRAPGGDLKDQVPAAQHVPHAVSNGLSARSAARRAL